MRKISIEDIRRSIRDIPDFPKQGILFKDLTTAFKDPLILSRIADELTSHYENAGVTKVVGIESRGFILGSILADRLGAGFVPIRKPGKLPAETYSVAYDLEYGKDAIEIHLDAIDSSDVVLLHDDLLATGGTSGAAISLLRQFSIKKLYLSFIVELTFLPGREKIDPDLEVFSLVRF